MVTQLPSSLMEHALERQSVLEAEAKKYRLLSELPKPTRRVSVLRQAVFFIGDRLIAGGAWLKQQAAVEPGCAKLQTVSDRFSQ